MSRIQRTALLVEFQNQKAHYQHIVNPRSTLKIQNDRRTITSHLKTRYYSEFQRNRKLQNEKIKQRLQSIHNHKGLLASVEQQSQNYEKRTSHDMAYRTIKAEQQRNSANKIMLSKLLRVKPKIGQKQEWDKHYHEYKSYTKKRNPHNTYQELQPSRVMNLTLGDINYVLTKPNTKNESSKRKKRQTIRSNQQQQKAKIEQIILNKKYEKPILAPKQQNSQKILS